MTELTVFARAGCGLCEAMMAELAPWKDRFGFRVREIDIDANPRLTALYGERVPVLVGERGEICHYFLDPDALARYFSAD